MAGHSKWANIQHRKNTQDAKRSRLFTRLIREITVSTRMGGGPDTSSNSRLRLAIDRALTANMSRDTIDRAIKRGAGELGDAVYEDIRYEGYGPGGVAVLVDCVTDNRNRTVAEVRHAFNKYGGNLGTSGSVAFLFKECGVLLYPPGCDEERILEAALAAGADDVIAADDGSVEVLTPPDLYSAVHAAMLAAGLAPAESEVMQRPSTTTPVSGEDAERLAKMLDVLEELDDTQNVASNADFPDDATDEA